METKELSQTSRLAWLLRHAMSESKVMFMLVAYFDESERHPVALLAGYLGYKEDWEAFEADWKPFLARENITTTGYHSVECAHRKPDSAFEHWTVERCQRVHREAVEIITRHPLLAICHAVHLPNFQEMYAEKVTAAGKFPQPRAQYYSCLHWILGVLGAVAKTRNPPETVDIIMDRMKGIEGRMQGFYDIAMGSALKELAPYISGPPLFRSSRDYCQLQAADVLAYELSIAHSRSIEPEAGRGERGSYDALRKHALGLSPGGEPLIRIDLEWERDTPS